MLQGLRLVPASSVFLSPSAGEGSWHSSVGPHHPSGVTKPGARMGCPARAGSGTGVSRKGRCQLLRRAQIHSPGLRSGWLGGCERQILLILSKEILFRLKPV